MGIVIILYLCYAAFNSQDMPVSALPQGGFVYVCICNQVTDREIHGAVQLGVSTLDELAETLGVGTCCGRCRDCAQQVLAEGVAASCHSATVTVTAQTVHVVQFSSCSSSVPRAIMDTRDPAVANDQQTELVA